MARSSRMPVAYSGSCWYQVLSFILPSEISGPGPRNKEFARLTQASYEPSSLSPLAVNAKSKQRSSLRWGAVCFLHKTIMLAKIC